MATTRALRTSRGGRQVRSGAPPGALVINTRGIVWVYVHCWLASSVVDWTLSYILHADIVPVG